MTTLDTTTLRALAILLQGATEAYESPLLDPDEAPCSVCGCASPAREFAECGRADCPVEGEGRL